MGHTAYMIWGHSHCRVWELEDVDVRKNYDALEIIILHHVRVDLFLYVLVLCTLLVKINLAFGISFQCFHSARAVGSFLVRF